MDYNTATQTKDGVLLEGVKHFSLPNTLDCGQSFRWEEIEPNHFSGIAFKKYIELIHIDDNILIKYATLADFENHWKEYFDLNTDYGELTELFREEDTTLGKAIDFAPGIRVLKQEPWEALASFILSQNNNIKRIKGLVLRFCENFGEKIDGGYAFPEPEAIASLTVDDLSPVRAGFRSKYLIDAAQRVVDGTVSLSAPYDMPIDEAREHLMQIKGVGPKVSDCALLYGFYRIETMPIDVWVKRALAQFYPDGFPESLKPWSGIAQQYIFNYIRLSPDVELAE